ncbi:MAG: hypothetical protein WC624_02620, partial [Candidatus Margulisiibacteriota bacterium]
MKLKLTLIAGFIIMMAAGSGGALTPVREWGNTGKVISNNQGPAVQVYPAACRTSDGYTIVAWADERGGDLANGYYQVYVQKLDSNGIGSWNTAEAGVAIATAYATVGSGMIENYKICIVPDSAGGAIVSWLDQRSGVAIYAQRVDGNGTVQWTAGGIPVVTNSAGYSTVNSFRMTADGSGGIIICWGDDRNQQSKYDLYAQKIGSNGSLAWSANGVELYSSPYSKTFQQLVSDGTGGAVVASIVATDGTGSDIITLNITSAGTIAWVSTVCQAANDEANPQIVGSGTDKYIITWEDNRLMASGDSNIYAQALNGYGTAEWAANGVSICSDLNTAQTKPSIIADGSGGAVITWHDGRGNDIYAQRVNGSGEAQWTVDGVAVCSSTVYQTAPQIVGTGSGGSIIFWPDTRNDTSGFNYSEIFAQKLNGSGAAQWTANGIKFSGNTKQYFYSEFLSAPVEDGSGGALIFWTDINTDTNGDIYGTKATNDGTAAWGSSGEAICAAKKSVDQDQPVLSQDGLVIAWRDAKNGQTDIYAQKIDPATGNSLWAATDVAVATGAGTRNLGGIRRTSDGKYAVVWEDQRNASSDIYLQYLNSADGASLLTANGFRVTSSSNNEIQPAVAPDDNGGVVVTWQNSGGGGIG